MKQNNDLLLKELDEERLESMIYEIKGGRVMMGFDLARIYGYSTKAFYQQVKSNIDKFPNFFVFRLSNNEVAGNLRSKILTANQLSSRRYNPYAFTEKGIYMLMTILRGELAIKQSQHHNKEISNLLKIGFIYHKI